MQLTERQCWEVIRGLVAEKNKEYASFLNKIFDERNLAMCIGYTKNAYLGKFGFSEEGELRYLIKRRGTMPKREWLDNLSAEDLLLFLDFRCRSLQRIYDYYAQNGTITLKDIQEIINSTKRSDLIGYNSYRLKATGKPNKVEGDKKISELNIDTTRLVQIALIQTMGKIAYNYANIESLEIDKSIAKTIKLSTTNIDNMGNTTGHKFMGDNTILRNYVDTKFGKVVFEDIKQDETKTRIIGFDEYKNPIFVRAGKQVNFLGNEVPDAVIKYDCDGKLIEQAHEVDKQDDNLHAEPMVDEVNNIAKFVGLDIQGSPVYEIDGQYYNSIGERLEEDVYVQQNNEDFSL